MRPSSAFMSSMAVLVSLSACSPSTQVTRAWKAQGIEPAKFGKIIAVCMCADEGLRRSVEDRLTQHMPNAVAGYTVLSTEQQRNTDEAKAVVRQGGFDGAVVMQLVGNEKETTYTPGTAYAYPGYYGSMWGAWGYGSSVAYSPGYVTEDQVVSFDTNVYSVADGKLLWSSRSKTYNPGSVSGLVDDIVTSTVSEMKKQGVLKKEK